MENKIGIGTFLSHFSLPISFTIIIIAFSLASSGSIQRLGLSALFGFDKIAHCLCYGLNMYFYSRVIKKHQYTVTIEYLAILLFLLGIILEWIQSKMGLGRILDVYDIIANGIGILLGYLISIKQRIIR